MLTFFTVGAWCWCPPPFWDPGYTTAADRHDNPNTETRQDRIDQQAETENTKAENNLNTISAPSKGIAS